MIPIESAKDVFFLVLALSILIITLLTAWILYYVIRMFRQANNMVQDVRNAMKAVINFFDSLKEKSSNAAAYMTMLVKGGEEIMDYVKEKKATSKKTKGNQ